MHRTILTLFLATAIISGCKKTNQPDSSLVVSENNCYLTYPDGKPFLWIGDTAWELFHKLNREEADEYLQNRAEKGISVIQAVVLAENDGLRVPNAYGEIPLLDMDPTRPNEAYFEHVDFVVNRAEELGLFIGMLPTWGDKVFSVHPGAGPVVFNKENAFTFGEYLGTRYKDKPIIWVLGGDRNIANLEVLDIWRAMAAGLKKGDGGRNLITYHPRGASSSSVYLHNEAWLDFNMYQSGHDRKYNDLTEYTRYNTLLQPRKPFLDGEPAYEDIAVQFWNYMDFSRSSTDRVTKGVLDEDGIIQDRSHFEMGFFTDADVRVLAYRNFLSGACGFTYGNNAIWQMFSKGGNIAIPALTDWREAMDRPGAFDLQHLRRILEIRPFNKLIPDQSIIFGPNPGGEKYITSAIADDGSFMLIHFPVGQKGMLNLDKIDNDINAWWYDPREGTEIEIGTFDKGGIIEFTPPTSGHKNDWLLVLDDASNELKKL